MTWRTLWQKLKQKATAPRYKHFDSTLLRTVRSRFFPRWNQLRYLGKFLNPGERKLISGAAAVVTVAALFALVLFLMSHIVFGPANGGEYTESLVGQPQYLNPIYSASNDIDSDLTKLIYSGLFTHDQTGQIIPDLAKSYSLSSDGKIYSIELRPNILWSDRQPLTSDDVAFTIETIQNKEAASPLAAAFQDVKVEKIDAYNLRLTLKQPFAFFLSALTVGILPEHAWGEITPANLKLAKLNLQPIGSGPWQVGKITKDQSGTVQNIILRPNDQFYGQPPYLNSLNFKFVGDYSLALEALRNQTVLAVSFPPRASTKKIGNKNIKFYNLVLPQYTGLFFNPLKNSFLKNNDFRVALTSAIDKTSLVSSTLEGAADAVNGPIIPHYPLYSPVENEKTFDQSAANAILDKTTNRLEPEEYYKIRQGENKAAASTTTTSTPTAPDVDQIRQEMDTTQSFYRQDKTTKDIITLTITTADTPEYHSVAEKIAEYWRALGIKISVRYVPSRQFNREVIKNRDYEVVLYGEILGSDPDLYPFWHSSQSDSPGLNLARYSNKDVDQWLESARITSDIKAQTNFYKKIQNKVVADSPAVFLYTPHYLFLANQDLRGVDFQTLLSPADRYNDLSNWYLKTSWHWKQP